MSKTDYSKIISGEPIKTIVRIKPPANYSREDLKVTPNKISLLDQNNRCKTKNSSKNKNEKIIYAQFLFTLFLLLLLL